MKYDNLRAFEKHLEACIPGQFADLYLILSKEDFDRSAAVKATTAALLKGCQCIDLALKTFDGESLSLDALLDELNTLPFLTDRKVVLVQRVDNAKKAITKALEEYLANPNRAVKLVMSAEAVAANTTFYKKSEKTGVVLSIPQKKAWEKEKDLYDCVMDHIAKAGKRIDPRAAQLLVKQTGLDQGLLKMELEKLLCYVNEQPEITPAAVSAICTCIDADTVFQFSEAVLRRQSAQSLLVANHLLDGGAALLSIIIQLRSQFHTDYQVCSILSSGGSPQDVSQEFRFMMGKILNIHIEMATGYGMERFKKGLLAIDEAERMAKSSSMEPRLLLERLVVKLTA